MKSNNNDIKIVLIFLFSLFSFTIYLVSNYSLKGYFFSIYDNFPFYVWIILPLLIITSIIIAFECNRRKTDYWKIGLLLILFCNTIIILIPYLTGYSFNSSSDSLTHIGYIKDILNTGTISSAFNGNVYPITHILTAELCEFTNLSLIALVNFIGLIFYFLFIIYTYVFAKSLTTKKTAVFAVIASTALLAYYYTQIFPLGFALITFPLIFYLYNKHLEKREPRWTSLIILFIFVITFIHPIAAIILTIVLFFSELLISTLKITKVKRIISKSWLSEVLNGIKSDKIHFSMNLPLILLIIIIVWMWQTTWLWNSSISNVLGWLNLELLNKPMIELASDNFTKLGLNFFQIIKLFFLMYGPVFIYVILSTIVIIKILFKTDISSFKNKFMFILSFIMIIFILLWLCDYAHPLTKLTSGRFIYLIIVMVPIFVGLALKFIVGSEFLKKHKINEKIIYLFVSLIIGLCSITAIFAIYPSPLIYQTNTALTNSESDGAYWMMNNQYNNKVIGIDVPDMSRFENAFEGTLNTNYSNTNYYGKYITPGDHFNYTTYNNLGDIYSADTYMMLEPNYLVSLYQGMYKNLNRFDNEDFMKLDQDPTTNMIYDNGQMEIWYIKANKTLITG